MADLDTYKIKVTVDNKEWRDAANQRADDRKKELAEVKSRLSDQSAVLKSQLQKELVDYKNAAAEKLRIARQTQSEMNKQSLADSKMSIAKSSLGGFTGGTVGEITAQVSALQTYRKTLSPTGQELRIVDTRIKELNGTLGKNTASLTTNVSAITSMTKYLGGMAMGYLSIAGASKIWDIGLETKRLEVLKDNFKGTAEELENFKIATAGNVTEENLLKLANQSEELGVDTKSLTILMSLAETASDKWGASIEESLQKIIVVSQGVSKGKTTAALSAMGIEAGKYNDILMHLVMTETGAQKVDMKTIDTLDSETATRLRLNAMIQASGETYETAVNKQKDAADKQQSIMTTAKDLFMDYLMATDKWGRGFQSTLIDAGKGLVNFQADIRDTIRDLIGLQKPVDIQIKLHGLEDLHNDVISAVDFIHKKFRDAGLTLPGIAHDIQQGATRSTETKGTGKSPRTETEKEIVSLIDQETKKLADLNKELLVNQGVYGAELEIRNKIREVEERIFFLRTGVKAGIDLTGIKPQTMTDLEFEIQRRTGRNPNIPGGFTPLGQGRPISKELSAALDEIAQSEINANKQALGYAQEFVGLFGTLPGIAEDVKNIFFKIMEGLLNGGSGGGFFGFLANALFGAIMGPGAVSMGGGGGAIFGGGGMPHPNFNPFNRPGDILPPVVGLPKGFNQGGNTTIIIKNPITLKEALEIVEIRNSKSAA